MTNVKNILTIASTLVGAIALADKAIKRVDDEKAAVRRGYKEVHASSMACDGLKLGEFCVTNDELCIHLLPDDMTGNTVITSIYITDRISNIDCDIDTGFYAVTVNGRIRRAFFDGENFLILGKCNAIKVNRKADIETADMYNELRELRKQLDRTKRLECEVDALHKQIEQLKKPAKTEKAEKSEK